MDTDSTGNEAETAPKSDTPGAQSVGQTFTEEELADMDAMADAYCGDNGLILAVPRLIAELRELRTAGAACADDLEAELMARPDGSLRRYERDIAPVRRLRALLPTLPAPDGGTT